VKLLGKWEEGRQRTGYRKRRLLEIRWPLPLDAYLLHYRRNGRIGTHVDTVPGRRHYRLNVVLKRAPTGGTLLTAGRPILRLWSGRVTLFRSDREHLVLPVIGGDRWVLSIGCAPKERR
jgi:hypothetical protein